MSLDACFRALNRYMCRKVLDQLRRRGPMSVADLTLRLKLTSRPNISQALALLLEAGLVSRQRQGRNNFYQLRPCAFKEAVIYLEKFQFEEPSSNALTHS